MPASGNLLTNDDDPDGNILMINTQPVISPVSGTLVINPDGSYIYTPNPGYTGTDSFVYEVCDNGTPSQCDQATVTITVMTMDATTNPLVVNNPPIANNDAYQISVGFPVKGKVISNDYDLEGNLDLNSVKLLGNSPSNGTLTLNSDGTFTYLPVVGFIGKVNFDYQVCDTGTPSLCSSATVTIEILASKVVNSTFATDDSYYGKKNNPVNGNVLSNDNDPQGNLQVVNTTPAVLPAHGTLVLNSDGSFVYTPTANYTGNDQFVYEVCDDGTPKACDQGTVYLTVIPANNPPVAKVTKGGAVTDPIITPEDTPITGSVTATDVDGDALYYSKASNPGHGTVIVNSYGSYIYTPDNNYNGPDSFMVTVNDGHGGTDTVTVYILVTPVNKKPIANDDVLTVTVDGVFDNTVSNNDILSGDGGEVWTLVTSPSKGTIVFNPDGSYTYTPDASFTGEDSFIYRLCDIDGDCTEAKVTITIEDIILPNQIITPNGDGTNDTFIIGGVELYPNNRLIVYNRWGNVVYQKSGYLNEWDGNSNVSKVGNKPLPAGTYFYILEYGSKNHKTGYVYIDRK